jgi:hypothetical protein
MDVLELLDLCAQSVNWDFEERRSERAALFHNPFPDRARDTPERRTSPGKQVAAL